MLRAQLLGGTPSELLGAITGLTEARFPVHAAAHFTDGFPTVPQRGSAAPKTLVGTTIYAQAGAPVIAVQDGEVVQIGDSPTLGRFVSLRDAYGNTYTYAQLGSVASRVSGARAARRRAVSARTRSRPAPDEPAPERAGDGGRAAALAAVSEGAAVSGLALGARRRAWKPRPRRPAPPRTPRRRAGAPHAAGRATPARRACSAKAPTTSTCTRCAPACR